MIIIVDIDETIAITPEDRNYENSVPIKENIEVINKLHDEGHSVIYWTARGGGSGIDWSELTRRQIKEWGARCAEVRLGKPMYDIFICDKAVNSIDFFSEMLDKKENV